MSVLFCPLPTVFSVYLLQNEEGFDVCAYLTWLSPSQLSCLPTFRNVRKGWFQHVSVPGFPSVMSFYSSLGENEVVLTYVCTWFPSVSCLFFTSRKALAVVRTCFSPDS